MIETLERMLSPEYLVVGQPGPLGRGWVLFAALGLAFAAGLVASVRALILGLATQPERRGHERAAAQGRGGRRALAWFEVWVCLAGLGVVGGRVLGWAGWSARIWPLSLAVLALLGALAYRLRTVSLPGWLADLLHTLALKPTEPAVAWLRGQTMPLTLALGVAVHTAGIALVVVTRFGLPVWVAPVLLAVLLTPQAPLLAQRRLPRLVALAPLFGAYAATLLWLAYQWAGITVVGWQGLMFPDPWTSLFYLDGICLGAVAHSALCTVAITSSMLGRPQWLWRSAATGLLVATLAWAAVVYLGKHTHGATASDPYAYAQMGQDLAERGTFLHRFALFQQVIPLDIAWAPLQPVGYHVPRNGLGDCPSVWATGAAVLLAAGYLLLGEVGLYVATPVVALLALAATWALVLETLHDESTLVRYVTGALTVALLATSPEFVDRLLVPMADATALLFSTLALLFALRGMRLGRAGQPKVTGTLVLSGLFFGWAYWVRHTQLVLAVPILLAVVWSRPKGGPQRHWGDREGGPEGRMASAPHPSRQLGRDMAGHAVSLATRLSALLAAALVGALPDIIYRWRTFGSPLATETTELPAMGWQYFGPVAGRLVQEVLVAGEWGYLFPLAIIGAYHLARRRGRQATILGAALAAVLIVHLTYRFLRLRDLISLFPLLDLAVAYGAVLLAATLTRLAQGTALPRRLGAGLLPAAGITWIVLCLALARWAMIDDLLKPGWASFGYVRANQRAAFDRLASLTPPNAVIGASLNAGAIMMYTGRDAIRPYDSWTDAEWRTFLEAMRAGGRSVYLLDDGELMASFIEQEANRHRLAPIEALEVPLFNAQGRQTGWLYRVE